MKILVLGNGFDLDHNLPTGYTSFLNFCNCILSFDATPKPPCFEELTDHQQEYIATLEKDKELLLRFKQLLHHNYLLAYFNNRKERISKNWIDLEQEMKSVVSEFKSILSEFDLSQKSTYKVNKEHRVHQLLKDMDLSIDGSTWTENSLNVVHTTLCTCLDKFSKALELYISKFVNRTPINGVAPDIINFNAKKVLSFNYSNTYERIYGGVRWGEDIEYIHGQATDSLTEQPNIILGITSDDNFRQSSYVEFEKYYQRITKKTGNNYKTWLQTRILKSEKIEVAFFGHSLDPSDSDIITDLVCNEKTAVKVFYHNQKSYQQIVANLIDIIGKDQLIQFVSGKKTKITFIQQSVHNKDRTSGVEIVRDTQKLFRLYSCSDKEITAIFDKIFDRIKKRDKTYFHSQKKAISLFDALGYHIKSETYLEEFVAICELFDYEKDRNGKLKPHIVDEWLEYTPWGDEIPCDRITANLIKRVNLSNKEKFAAEEAKKSYANILNLADAESVKDALLQLFQEKHPTEEYWNQLNELIVAMANNAILEKAFTLIREENLSIPAKAKFRHFERCYDQYCYNLGLAKQLEKDVEATFDQIN